MNRSRPLKRLFQIISAGAWGSEPGVDDVDLPCVRIADFDYQRLTVNLATAPERSFRSADAENRSARSGDLILERSGGGERSPVGRAIRFVGPGTVMPTNFASRLRPIESVDHRFACYLMASLYTEGWNRANINQTTGIQNLDLQAFLRKHVDVPETMQQKAIADYLDRETARIDALIEKKIAQSSLLRDRQDSLATTLFDASGAKRMNLKQLGFELQTGPFGSQLHAESYGGEWPVVNPTNIVHGRILATEYAAVSNEVRANLQRHILFTNDIVVARRGEFGRAGWVDQAQAGWVCGTGCIRVRHSVRSGLARFVWRYLQLNQVKQVLQSQSVGSTMDNLNTQILAGLVIPALDSDSAIDEIMRRLDALDERTDSAFNLISRELALLTEKRQALITGAVTGQVPVPGAA